MRPTREAVQTSASGSSEQRRAQDPSSRCINQQRAPSSTKALPQRPPRKEAAQAANGGRSRKPTHSRGT
eukprot:1288674-Alexandrium_andersonii.AAC.1